MRNKVRLISPMQCSAAAATLESYGKALHEVRFFGPPLPLR